MEKIKDAIKTVVQRYGTSDPFRIADYLNIEVRWSALGNHPLGKTIYDHDDPIVMLNDNISDTPKRYYVMAHELGHVILHEGLSSYYTGAYLGHNRLENEANEFAIGLMGIMYNDDNDRPPETIYELQIAYDIYDQEFLE